MVATASPAAWASLSKGHVGLSPGCSQASGSAARRDLGTGLGCGSGSYGHHVRRLSVRLSVGGSGSRPGAAPGRVGKGLTLCCLSSTRVRR